jgi:hypothetical protein
MQLNGNSGYGKGSSMSVTGVEKLEMPPVAITVCKPVTVWRTGPGK